MTSTAEPPDVDAIVDVVARQYYGGWFEQDPDRMRAALHPELVKRGLLDDGTIDPDTAATMIEATAAGFGGRHPVDKRHLEVVVDHVHGDIATAHAVGDVYVDYLQLVRVDGRWQILNALWARA